MSPLVRSMAYLLPYWPWLLACLAMVIAVTVLSLVSPLVIQWMVDRVLGERRFDLLLWGPLLVVGVSLARGVLFFFQRYLIELAAQRAIFDLRNRLYRHLQGLSFSFYDQAQTGSLMTRMVGDVETLKHFFGQGLIFLAANVMQIAAVAAALFYLNWRLALAAFLTSPFLFWSIVQMSRQVRPAFWEMQQQMAALTSVLQENVTGIRVVRSFAREGEEIEKFDRESRLYLEKNLEVARLSAFYLPLMTLLSSLSLALVLWYGGILIIRGQLTPGGLLAFNGYLLILMQPVRMLGFLISLANRAAASSGRLVEILDTPAAVADRLGARPLGPVRGEIRFENVSFSYDGRPPVLEEINLTVRPGERVAIVGPTGSGKTSLINLVPRFYDPTAGRVLIDGRDIRQVTIESLRRQIGVVSQDTFLFSASLRENISYGRPNAPLREVIEAAKTAQIHDFIASLPNGYDTLIGERGIGLSGGQKQRVAIARALLVGARIMILDESTSSVDVHTEELLRRAFEKAMEGRTSLVIAQRLSTVRSAGRIIVLDRGRLVEQGTHEELLARGGLYRRVYDLQFRDQRAGDREVVPNR